MTFKRSVVSAAVLGASVFSGSALAELSGNVGVTSQYLFRGLAQSDGAAVQGGLDYSSESGFYVGTWASTINFGGTPNLGDGGSTGAEVDFYVGFSGEAGGVGYDIGAIYYWYSEEDELDNPDTSYNTIEIYGSLSFGMLTLGGYYAPDTYFGVDESAYGVNLAFSAPVSDKLSFDAFIGHNGGKGNEAFTPDGDTYLDYSIGLSTETEIGISMSIAFVGTDIKDDDPKLVLSGGYSFGL
jgi:uncharacterized protein (TIGR02001 family)